MLYSEWQAETCATLTTFTVLSTVKLGSAFGNAGTPNLKRGIIPANSLIAWLH